MQNTFTIFPAIDLKNGQCVRLRQGLADQATVYGADPVAMAQHWEAQGAMALHVVDLDGAFAGAPRHTEIIRTIITAVKIPVQVGGGLRRDADLSTLIDAGAARVIIGTRAVAADGGGADLKRLTTLYGDKLAVGIDARNGLVQVRGWTETTPLQAVDLARNVCRAGVSAIIYTDTATDGMLQGPNQEATLALCRAVDARIIASGGVATAEHVRRLAQLDCPNLHGVIVGRALYEKTATLPDLLAAARSNAS
ncbi:MAG: 1-(5-phosphoribosyl)-5-[(5-phosphoribosylamino)methylideneamino]imidazole-4-carboxamide isomerase [Kiritimatiellia bacterium]|nr:1-(5-phosphoribosyl)-5-[(5-phosphoribosylamino)methylideneamino]imidazole-4-carboxamide isomerase [Lentisphaerota bacterium]